jgi:hypothetical protein
MVLSGGGILHWDSPAVKSLCSLGCSPTTGSRATGSNSQFRTQPALTDLDLHSCGPWAETLRLELCPAELPSRHSPDRLPSGQNPVTSSTRNVWGEVTAVTYGSADSSSFSYDLNTGRMTQYKSTINGSAAYGNLTWNPNGSLGTLAITDPFTSANAQTCNYSYDDLGRISAVDCGTDLIPSFGTKLSVIRKNWREKWGLQAHDLRLVGARGHGCEPGAGSQPVNLRENLIHFSRTAWLRAGFR